MQLLKKKCFAKLGMQDIENDVSHPFNSRLLV
jgi:hypothetical protein